MIQSLALNALQWSEAQTWRCRRHADRSPRRRQPIIFTIIAFSRGGVSKLTINCSLIFSLFHPLIQFSCEKRLNDQINRTNNDAINGMFERPYSHRTSNLVKNRAPNNLSTSSGISGIGAAFLTVIAFSGR